MSDTTIQPTAPANTPAPNEGARDTGGSPAASEQHTDGDAAPPADAGQSRQPREDWRDTRFRRMSAQKIESDKARQDAENRAAALQAELDRMRSAAGSTGQDNVPDHRSVPTPAPGQARQSANDDAEVERRVQERAYAQTFNATCDRVARDGAAAFPDFQVAAAGWFDAGLNWNEASHRELFTEISELPNAAEVFYRLGQDRNEVSHLLGLGPRAQARALDRFVSGMGSQGQTPDTAETRPAAQAPRSLPVSAAPPPSARAVATGSPSGKVDLMDPSAPMDDRWMAEWKRQNGYSK